MAKNKIPTPKSNSNGLEDIKSQLNLQSSPLPEFEPEQPKKEKASKDFVDMSFKVEPAFRQEFKSYASARGLSMKDLLEASFEAYKGLNL